MALLKQEISNRGVQGVIPAPNEEIQIPVLDVEDINMAVALFGTAVMSNPQLSQLVNRMGPVLFAALLFTVSEDYQVDPNDPDTLVPNNDVIAAENLSIGMIRAVASAVGNHYGTLTTSPTDTEVDDDTDLVNPA